MVDVIFRSFDYDKDLERLFTYMMKEENQILFSHSFQLKTIQAFEKWITDKLNHTYHDFFMIQDSSGQTLGFTFSYEFFQYDGHCKFTVCLYEEYQNMGYGAIAGINMLDYLFEKYPLRQVITSVFNYNEASLSVNRKSGFVEIGTFPEYRYYNGEYHSLHLFAITKEVFYKRNSKFLK